MRLGFEVGLIKVHLGSDDMLCQAVRFELGQIEYVCVPQIVRVREGPFKLLCTHKPDSSVRLAHGEVPEPSVLQ